MEFKIVERAIWDVYLEVEVEMEIVLDLHVKLSTNGFEFTLS